MMFRRLLLVFLFPSLVFTYGSSGSTKDLKIPVPTLSKESGLSERTDPARNVLNVQRLPYMDTSRNTFNFVQQQQEDSWESDQEPEIQRDITHGEKSPHPPFRPYPPPPPTRHPFPPPPPPRPYPPRPYPPRPYPPRPHPPKVHPLQKVLAQKQALVARKMYHKQAQMRKFTHMLYNPMQYLPRRRFFNVGMPYRQFPRYSLTPPTQPNYSTKTNHMPAYMGTKYYPMPNQHHNVAAKFHVNPRVPNSGGKTPARGTYQDFKQYRFTPRPKIDGLPVISDQQRQEQLNGFYPIPKEKVFDGTKSASGQPGHFPAPRGTDRNIYWNSLSTANGKV